MNALGVPPAAIKNLLAVFSDSASRHGSEHVAIVHGEFNRLYGVYHDTFSSEVQRFTCSFFDQYVFTDCIQSFALSYDIAGDAMEKRSGANVCARTLRLLLGKGGKGFEALRSRCSTYAYAEVVKEFAYLLTETIISHVVMRKSFSEWGALLLQEEVSAAIHVFEEDNCDTDDISVQVMFEKLKWTTKILSIIQPVDIQRYQIPYSCADEERVRGIMGRRVDLLKAAVENVKLSFV